MYHQWCFLQSYRILQDKFADGLVNKFHPRMIRIGSGQSSKVHALNGEKEVNYIMDLAKHPSTLYQQINTYRIKKEAAKNKMLKIFSLYFHNW